MSKPEMRAIRISSVASRALIDEITALRDDIHSMASTIAELEITLLGVFDQLIRSNTARLPPPPDAE